MRLIGYCEDCKRVRQVRVRHWTGAGMALGRCDDCSLPPVPSPRPSRSPRAVRPGRGPR